MGIRKRKNSLIPRYKYPYVIREVVTGEVTEDNPFDNNTESYSFTKGVIEAGTVQTLSNWELNSLPEGNDSSQLFRIFTNTALYSALEGSSRMSDSIYLPDVFFALEEGTVPSGVGGWFNVVKAQYRNVGIITHCEVIVAKDDYQLNREGLDQYPDTADLDALLTSRNVLLDSSIWESTWTEEDV